jgi:hypothetical protein
MSFFNDLLDDAGLRKTREKLDKKLTDLSGHEVKLVEKDITLKDLGKGLMQTTEIAAVISTVVITAGASAGVVIPVLTIPAVVSAAGALEAAKKVFKDSGAQDIYNGTKKLADQGYAEAKRGLDALNQVKQEIQNQVPTVDSYNSSNNLIPDDVLNTVVINSTKPVVKPAPINVTDRLAALNTSGTSTREAFSISSPFVIAPINNPAVIKPKEIENKIFKLATDNITAGKPAESLINTPITPKPAPVVIQAPVNTVITTKEHWWIRLGHWFKSHLGA